MFGLFHGNFGQFFYAFAVGSVFAYVALRTGGIRYTVVLHFLVNFFGMTVSLAVDGNLLLTALYGVLYLLLKSENNALLMGSLLLFGILAAIMWVTRKVDWYALGTELR